MKKKSCFIVVNNDYFFLSHRLPVALSALNAGYDVTIVAKKSGRQREIEAHGLRFVDLPIDKSGMNLWKELITFRFLFCLYRSQNPDIVHHVGLKTILWGALAAKFARVRGIVNAVSGLGFLFIDGSTSLMRKMLLLFFRFINHGDNVAVIFQNNEDKELFLRHKIVKPRQIY
ncbi:MAG: hypothetical protein LBC89_00030 [Bacteroidales bacterium]|jgi:hypothetical protein|nr:hypothetical protein [Bacteroidales bacterium]